METAGWLAAAAAAAWAVWEWMCGCVDECGCLSRSVPKLGAKWARCKGDGMGEACRDDLGAWRPATRDPGPYEELRE